MGQSLRVLVIHNDSLVYEGIRAVLQPEPDLVVVGEARNASSASTHCADDPPHVAVLHTSVERACPCEVFGELHRFCDAVPTVVIASLHQPRSLRRLAALGPGAIVEKETAAGQLSDAIRAVAGGHFYAGPRAARELMSELSGTSDEDSSNDGSGYRSLSSREREVFRMLAHGRTNKEIAFELGISRKTVETYHARVCRKLDIHDVVGLLRYAVQIGVINFEEWVASYHHPSLILPRPPSPDIDQPTPD